MREKIKFLKSKIMDDLQSIKKIYDKLNREKEKIKITFFNWRKID